MYVLIHLCILCAHVSPVPKVKEALNPEATLKAEELRKEAERERQDKLEVVKKGKPITDKWSIGHVVLFLEGVDELVVL